MEKRESQEKLGTMPVGKLLAVMSLPMMISMLVQALYNAVDAMFVYRLRYTGGSVWHVVKSRKKARAGSQRRTSRKDRPSSPLM